MVVPAMPDPTMATVLSLIAPLVPGRATEWRSCGFAEVRLRVSLEPSRDPRPRIVPRRAPSIRACEEDGDGAKDVQIEEPPFPIEQTKSHPVDPVLHAMGSECRREDRLTRPDLAPRKIASVCLPRCLVHGGRQ